MSRSFWRRARRLLRGRMIPLSACVLTASTVIAVRQCITRKGSEPPPKPVTHRLPPSSGEKLPTQCIGSAKSSRQAIFLHGLMPAGSRVPPELDYTQRLSAIAAATGYRIAAPASRQICNAHQFCWPGSDRESLLATYARILHSSAECLDLNQPFGVIGFSNGGYHATRVVMRCLAPQPAWVLAIGSAGDPAHAEGRDLAACAPTTLMAGEADGVTSAARQLAGALAALQLPVRFVAVGGGHDLPDADIISFLRAKHSKSAK